MFSVDGLAPVSRTFFETRGSKLSINNIEIQASVTALEQARLLGYPRVRLCTSSNTLKDIITKHLTRWKQKKWKKCNGSRLSLPISLLKKLDRLLAVVDVEVVRVARGSCPEMVMAEGLAKQSCIDFSGCQTAQNTNDPGGAPATTTTTLPLDIISKQMERKISSTIKQRQKEHGKRKLKRLMFRGMKKKIQLT